MPPRWRCWPRGGDAGLCASAPVRHQTALFLGAGAGGAILTNNPAIAASGRFSPGSEAVLGLGDDTRNLPDRFALLMQNTSPSPARQVRQFVTEVLGVAVPQGGGGIVTRILVTGGAGFLGSHPARDAVAASCAAGRSRNIAMSVFAGEAPPGALDFVLGCKGGMRCCSDRPTPKTSAPMRSRSCSGPGRRARRRRVRGRR